MKINLFCDACENSENFEKVRVIEVYSPENKNFELTTDDTVYIRCRRCGSVDILEYEDGEFEEIEKK